MRKKRSTLMSRRRLLQTGAAFAIGPVAYASGSSASTEQPARQSIYESLGLKHIINATGTVTNLGGCRLSPRAIPRKRSSNSIRP